MLIYLKLHCLVAYPWVTHHGYGCGYAPGSIMAAHYSYPYPHHGFGFSWVWVWVQPKVPMSYPCRTLSSCKHSPTRKHAMSSADAGAKKAKRQRLTVTMRSRVVHGYTIGQVFPHCTCTCVHCNLWWVRPILYHNLCSVKQNLQFLFIKIL